MIETYERMETPIHHLVPKHKWGPFAWGGEIVRSPVVIEELCGSVAVTLRDYGRIPSWHSNHLVSNKLIAVIYRTHPDTIHLGVSVSEATYDEISAVTGLDINQDPDLSKRFQYIPGKI